jgi:hypothetical protein
MSRGRDKDSYSNPGRPGRVQPDQNYNKNPDTPSQGDYNAEDLPGEPTTDAKDPKKKKS